MSSKYGILLVGGGRTHQENYAVQFATDPRCELIAVTDEADVEPRRAGWNQELAERLGVPLLPDLDQSLTRPDVHIASVCVEFERRARVAIRCANAGKHLYLDKPLATTNEQAARLVAAVHRAKVKSQMYSMLRMPWVQGAKRLVASGQLGDLVGIHCDLHFAKGRSGTADLNRLRKERFPPRRFTFLDSKRELFTTGVYSIGLMRGLGGRPVRRVYARTANYFFREHQRNDVEDFAAVTLEFEGGLVGTLSGGRIGWLSHPASGPMRLYLIGTRASQLVDASRPRLEVYGDAPAWRPGPPHPEDPMGFWRSTTEIMGGVRKFTWTTMQAATQSDPSFFVDCLETGRESDMSAAEGAEILKVLLAAYHSAATGRPVELA